MHAGLSHAALRTGIAYRIFRGISRRNLNAGALMHALREAAAIVG
jgi:hypothetical protein